MEMIEERCLQNLYPHSADFCTADCKKRGMKCYYLVIPMLLQVHYVHACTTFFNGYYAFYWVWQTLDYRWPMESSVSSLHVSCGGNGACVSV